MTPLTLITLLRTANNPFNVEGKYQLLPPRRRQFLHLPHRDSAEIKFAVHSSGDPVNAFSSEGILLYHSREVGGVEKISGFIEPGAEGHVFTFDGARGLGGDEVAGDGDFLPDRIR